MEDEDTRHDGERGDQVEMVTHLDVPGDIQEKVERLLEYNDRTDDQPNRERRIVPGNQTHNSPS